MKTPKFKIPSFSEYQPTGLLDSKVYKNSLKRLSFSLLNADTDEIWACMAFKKEPCPASIPNVDMKKGCRIIGIGFAKDRVENHLNPNASILDRLCESASFRVGGWLINGEAEWAFDYIWFDMRDERMHDLWNYLNLGDANRADNIAFKIIEGRKPLQ